MGRYPPGPRERTFGFRLASQMRQAPFEVFPQWGRQYGDLMHIHVAWLHVYLINRHGYILPIIILLDSSTTVRTSC
jgi:hypothetical protein